VSHRDAPLDGGLRERSLFDVGGRFHQLMGCPGDTLVLVRPDDHIASMTAMGEGSAQDLYRKVVGHPQVCSTG
jgi:3-(3-hydroxy-phenyl)propionate hydroxylase